MLEIIVGIGIVYHPSRLNIYKKVELSSFREFSSNSTSVLGLAFGLFTGLFGHKFSGDLGN